MFATEHQNIEIKHENVVKKLNFFSDPEKYLGVHYQYNFKNCKQETSVMSILK